MLFYFSGVACAQYLRYSDDGNAPKTVKNGVVSTAKPYIRVFFAEEGENFFPPYEVIHRNDSVFLSREIINQKSEILCVPTPGTSYFCVKDARGAQRMLKIIRSRSMWPNTIATIILFLLGTVAFYANRYRKQAKTRHVEDLLTRASQKHTKKYDCVTVLFADIQGFTKIAEHMNPDQLVDELDRYFIFFDELVERFGVEKIKTIGDAYMCAGGVPDVDSANPVEVALVGLGMIDYVKERRLQDKGFWNIRVGLNTGPVISGNLGHKKKVFDIWGDSVNTASRMESSSEPGEVNISDNTYRKICDYFDCEHRGRMPVKYKGEIDMYFVKRLKPMYAEPGSIYKPNEAMKLKIQLLKLSDFEASTRRVIRKYSPNTEKIFTMLLQALEMIARGNHLADSDMLICKLASMIAFLQVAFAKEYKAESAYIGDRLSRLRLSSEQIEHLLRVVTNVVQNEQPQSIVEEVIYDARYSYLSRYDIGSVFTKMYEAELERNKHTSKKEWFAQQRTLLQTIKYYTEPARKLAEVPMSQQVEVIDALFVA
ncbi:MAG: adenylate/guanylate cyclase domain-containing protein [Bacteroidia bacterium]|nr:adenylate/guanylate cyclase domain-containing protein [Bacteroidia bacterium]